MISAISFNIKNLKAYGDSLLVINQINGTWKCKSQNLKPMILSINKMKKEFTTISFHHIRRKFNGRADEMANRAMDSVK